MCAAALAAFAGLGATASAASAAPASVHDGAHDFDFEFGSWTARIRRLTAPLSGSDKWVDYTGPPVVRPVWDGAIGAPPRPQIPK